MAEQFKAEFKINGDRELLEKMRKLNKAAPDYILKAVIQAGNQFKKQVTADTMRATRKHTGNLYKGYKSSPKVTQYGGKREFRAEISGGNRKAKHYHLIEHGHKRVAQEVIFSRRGGEKYKARITPGFTPGVHTMEKKATEWSSQGTFMKYVEAAVQRAMKDGLI